MFLPVLLVRDFGIGGFLAFALPNCVGAGAMGWVLRSPGVSAALVNRHAQAMRAFSIVTALFHAFFLAWLGSWRSLPIRVEALIGIAAGVSVVVALLRFALRGTLAIVLWLCVLGTIAYWLANPGVYLAGPIPSVVGLLPVNTSLDRAGLLVLGPVCVFGFALCPYLDLTFHQARQSLPGDGGRRAFTLGFGVLFPTMIVFTLLYAGVFLFARHAALMLVLVHIAVQAGYTVGVHARALRGLAEMRGVNPADKTDARAGVLTSVLLVWLMAMLVHGVFNAQLSTPPGVFGAGEVVYRVFMSFYGLVFPAYVWLVMIPTRDGHSGLAGPIGRRKLIALIIAVCGAAPCYWLGFIDRSTFWLIPGLGIVLLSRLAARAIPR